MTDRLLAKQEFANQNLEAVSQHPVHRSVLFEKCRKYTRAKEAMAAGVYPYFHRIDSAQEPDVICEGRPMIMMSSNDYLGLTSHPKVKEAAIDAVRQFGTGCAGSRFLNGTLAVHEEMEAQLARFLGKEAAAVFPTGFQANLGAISALVGKDDFIVIDRMNHASIYDGCRLSYGQIKKYQHNDMANLEKILQGIEGRGALVVVDGVFSMEGDIVDLPGVVALCQRYGAGLMVDDAHSIGVLGKNGCGTGEHFNMVDDIDLIMVTYSKSLATIGGCIASTEEVIHFLRHHARSLMFSASLPPAPVAAATMALRIIEQEPERRQRLWNNANYLREGYQSLGFDTGVSETPVVPVVVGDEDRVLRMWRLLFDAGVFASPVLFPGVPKGKALLRTSCMATHTRDHLDRVLEIFTKVGRELGLIS
ncbi:MAG: aminotransferase class I/II-fold pyridoxal phosphate-dependent enzyme [Arenicellales bacterium]|nr:aminotransferase class I/II-fold pyridoxal phosphate-dependent enzyme [Arenicellales bacterium]